MQIENQFWYNANSAPASNSENEKIVVKIMEQIIFYGSKYLNLS